MQAEDSWNKYLFTKLLNRAKKTSHYVIIRGDEDCFYRKNQSFEGETFQRIVDNLIPKTSEQLKNSCCFLTYVVFPSYSGIQPTWMYVCIHAYYTYTNEELLSFLGLLKKVISSI